MATLAQKRDEFKNSNSFKFKCLEKYGASPDLKKKFIDEVEAIRKKPETIKQGKTPLCAPAAFLYCIAREKGDEFEIFILDLALTGKGVLGQLEIVANEKTMIATDIGIEPWNWVALASFRNMSSQGSNAAGMTLPITLTGWFKETGWFTKVRNSTNLAKPQSLDDLLEINTLPTSYVCLLINTKGILNSTATVSGEWTGAEHWVVLGDGHPPSGGTNGKNGTQIDINLPTGVVETPSPIGNEYVTPAYMDVPILDNKIAARKQYLIQGELNFPIVHWGGVNRTQDYHGLKQGILVEDFLNGYFGFVSAAM